MTRALLPSVKDVKSSMTYVTRFFRRGSSCHSIRRPLG